MFICLFGNRNSTPFSPQHERNLKMMWYSSLFHIEEIIELSFYCQLVIYMGEWGKSRNVNFGAMVVMTADSFSWKLRRVQTRARENLLKKTYSLKTFSFFFHTPKILPCFCKHFWATIQTLYKHMHSLQLFISSYLTLYCVKILTNLVHPK